MKTKKRIPLILTAALALSACASAADSATAAAPAETAAATPEPTAAPEPVGELRSTVHLSIFSNALYQTVFDGSTAQETTGTNVYKTDFSTGKTTLFYHADSIFLRFRLQQRIHCILLQASCWLFRWQAAHRVKSPMTATNGSMCFTTSSIFTPSAPSPHLMPTHRGSGLICRPGRLCRGTFPAKPRMCWTL